MRTTYGRLTGFTLAVALAASPAFAAKPMQAKSGVKVQGPKAPKSSISGQAVKATKTTSAPKTKVQNSKPPKATAPKAGATTKPAKAPKATTPKTNTGTTTTSVPPTTPTGTFVPTNPVAQKLSTKSNLLARVKGSLPAGTDLNAATAGFKNFGQFIAATNVSSNLGIDFNLLKSAMTGTDLRGLPTGQPTSSLGQAIQKLKPSVDGTVEASRAEKLANEQIASGGNQ